MNIKWIASAMTLFLTLSGNLFAQLNQLDISNTREGEKVEYCHQHKKLAQMMQDPAFVKAKQADEIEFAKTLHKPVEKSTIYKIPIVFHVLHNGGVENISDEQIMDALSILNRDYRLLNADAANVQSVFQGMPTDVEVEFVLATKAPNGTCFKGITRTLSPLSYQGSDGNAQVDAIVAGNDVYQGQWPGNKYMNVFICGEIGGAAGYTMNPSSWSANNMSNGIWILHDYVGAIGTSSENTSRALTHEVGHWLNLSHTWGPNNNPGNSSSCSTDDSVDDTPNCIGVTSCNLNANSCTAVDPFFGVDMKDNVENYMDYSYCSKMFTQGQVDRMRAALQVQSTGRFNIWQASNLTAVGATGSVYLCKAAFTASKPTICAGEQTQLLDDSYNAANGWTWEITPATGWSFATGSAATDQNPTILFNTSGLYTVKLIATDGTTTDDETKTDYIRVLPAASTIPYWEGFESYTSLSGLPNWSVENFNNNNAYSIENTTAHSGNQCAKLVNFGQASSSIDELISAPIDLSVIPSNGTVTLSFRYAYRKKTTADYEYLKVFITGDCGSNWAQRKTIGGAQLSSLTSTTSWKPTQESDWVTVHMINVTSAYFTDAFRMKFRFESAGGNNFYLDDINLYSGAPSDAIVLGVNENSEIGGLNLFPNPTEDEINVHFTLGKKEDLTVNIMDVSGKIVQQHLVKANEGLNMLLFDTNELASGMYFINLGTKNSSQTMQFVVK